MDTVEGCELVIEAEDGERKMKVMEVIGRGVRSGMVEGKVVARTYTYRVRHCCIVLTRAGSCPS